MFLRSVRSKVWHKLNPYSLTAKCGRRFTPDRVKSLRHTPGGKLCARCKAAR